MKNKFSCKIVLINSESEEKNKEKLWSRCFMFVTFWHHDPPELWCHSPKSSPLPHLLDSLHSSAGRAALGSSVVSTFPSATDTLWLLRVGICSETQRIREQHLQGFSRLGNLLGGSTVSLPVPRAEQPQCPSPHLDTSPVNSGMGSRTEFSRSSRGRPRLKLKLD